MVKKYLSRLKLLLLALVTLVSGHAYSRDIYIGTLTIKGSTLVLKRCDLVQNTYVLRDTGKQAGVVAKFIREPAHAKGIWYAEVIGDYEERNGKDGLKVVSFENVQEGKSCHFMDALGAMEHK